MRNLIILSLLLTLAIWWFKDPSVTTSNGTRYSYITHYPRDGSEADQLPMLVALHGNGDKPDNFLATALDQLDMPVRIVLFQAPLDYSGGYAWPWTKSGFEQYGDALNEAIATLATQFPSKGKPILLGFSGGAMMAYYQALTHGDAYSSIFPVSGKLDGKLIEGKTLRTGAKVDAYHGTADRVISASAGDQAVQLLKDKGVRVTMKKYSSGHHGMFTDMKPDITEAIRKKVYSL